MFTWTLLDAVIDIKYNPPKLRLLREIKRLTKVQNEAIMYESYIKNKSVITQLIIQEESLDRVALVQRKFLSRKARASFSGNKILMLEALVSRHNKSMRSNAYNGEQEIGDSDSDSDSDSYIGDNDDQNDIAANMGTHSSSHNNANTHETNTVSTSSAASQYSKNQKKKRIVLPFAKNIDNDDKHYMVPLDRRITHRDKTIRFYTDSSLGKDEYTSGSDLHSYIINDLTDTKSSHGSFNDDSFLQVVNIDIKNEPKVRKKREIIQLETTLDDDRPYSRPLQNLGPITVGLLPASRSNSPTGSRPNIQISDQLDQVDKLLAGHPISPMSSPSSSPIIRVKKRVTKKKEPLMKVTQIDTKRMNLWGYSSYDLDLLDDEFLDNDDDLSFATLSTYSDHRIQNAALNVITEKVRIKINQPDMAAMSKHPVTFPHDVFHDYVTVSLSSSDKVAASSQAWSHARAAKTVKSLPFHLQQRYKLSEKYSNKIDNDHGSNKDKVSLSSMAIEPPRPDFVGAKTNLKNKIKAMSFNKSNTLHDDDMSLSSHDSDMISLIDHHVETLISDSNSLGPHSLLSKVDIDENNDTTASATDIVQVYNDNFERNSYSKEFVDSYNVYHHNRQPESSFNHDDEFTVYDGLLKERKRLIEKRIIALHRVAKQNMGYKTIHNSSGDLTINPRKVIPFSRNDGRKNNNINFDYRSPEKYDSNPNKDDDDDASMASTISSLTYQRKDNDHITISPIGEAAIASYRGKNTKLKSNNLLAHLDGKYRQDNNKNRINIATSNTDYVKLTDGDSLDLSLSEMNSLKSKKLKNASHIAADDNPPPFVITSNKTKKRNQNIVKANAAIPELNTNNGSDDTSVKSLVSSISSKTISSSSPWLPHPNVMNTSHSYIIHKSDRATSWKDNMLLLNYSPVNPAHTLTTVKCQDSLREVFELYSKKKYPITTTRPLMQVGKKLNIKVNNINEKK